jgi:hypothetical protein
MPFMGYSSPPSSRRSPRSPGGGGLPGGVVEVTVVVQRGRGERVGLRIFSPDERPVTIVRGVARGGPADRAGLRVGDQVCAIDAFTSTHVCGCCCGIQSVTHTHTHTHTQSQEHTHPHTHAHEHTQTNTHTHMSENMYARTHTHTHTSHTQSHTRTHARARAHTHTRHWLTLDALPFLHRRSCLQWIPSLCWA